MKNLQHTLITILFIAFAFPFLCSSQDRLPHELDYEVNRIHSYISITQAKINEAQTLIDLDRLYKSSWVKEYISVEVLVSHEGKIRVVSSDNDTLSQAQKNIMKVADVGTEISVKVTYIPENTLKHNDPKEINFSFTPIPETEATYTGEAPQLMQYLEEQAIANIPDTVFQNYDLAAVKFSINENGKVIDVHIFESSKDEKIDTVLLEAISNMPDWNPAAYENGTHAKQEFVLTVGNMENCVVNSLNIR